MPRHLLGIFALCAAVLSGTAAASPVVYFATLTGPAESPPNTSTGTGTTFVTIDSLAHTLRVQIQFSGLTGTTTASHIHVINGPGDTDTTDTLGPVATSTPSFAGFPLNVTAGSMDQTYDTTLASSFRAGFVTASGGTAGTAEAALFSAIADGRAYLNIHTSVFPGGEIRGFLVPTPEPSSYALMLAGLGLLGWAGRHAGLAARRR
jgi:hypothetical protein